METSANTVIIGAGIVGCAVAEHLARLGRTDVVVLDQGPLFKTGGSTSHAPGLMFQTNASKSTTALASYSVRHYSELELDGEPCFYDVGSVEVAATPERWDDLKRKRDDLEPMLEAQGQKLQELHQINVQILEQLKNIKQQLSARQLDSKAAQP